jgi:hypothetical protein
MLKQITVCNNEHVFCKCWHNWQWYEILPKGATAEMVCDSLAVRPTLRICNGKNGNIHPIPGNINEIIINYVTLQCRILYIYVFLNLHIVHEVDCKGVKCQYTSFYIVTSVCYSTTCMQSELLTTLCTFPQQLLCQIFSLIQFNSMYSIHHDYC